MDILILFLIITIIALLYFLVQNLISLYIFKYGKNDEYYEQEPYEFKYQSMEEAQSIKPEIYECFIDLGFDSIPTEKELKARYRQLAKENHPDRGGNPEEFEKINKAYSDSLKILNAKK